MMLNLLTWMTSATFLVVILATVLGAEKIELTLVNEAGVPLDIFWVKNSIEKEYFKMFDESMGNSTVKMVMVIPLALFSPFEILLSYLCNALRYDFADEYFPIT